MKPQAIDSPSGQVASPHRNRPKKNTVLGVVFMLVSIACLTVMDALIKWMGAKYPLQELVAFRCTVAFILIAVLVLMQGGLPLLKTQNVGLHALRSALGLCAMGCAFYGYTVMPLADASSIFHTAPLLATAFSVPILGEKVGIRRWSCIVIGLIGVLIIVRPGEGVLGQGSSVMMLAAIIVALTINIVRKLNTVSSAICITFYFSLSGTVVSIIACLLFGWVAPSSQDWLWLISIGLLGGCGQYALTLSLRFGEIGLISPLKYLAIVFAALIGYVVWSEIPDMTTFLGMSIIIVSGLYSVYREATVASKKQR